MTCFSISAFILIFPFPFCGQHNTAPLYLYSYLSTIPKAIDETLARGTSQDCINLHMRIDSRYQACIKDWYSGFAATSNQMDRVLYWKLNEHPDYARHNLAMMRGKLESYCFAVNAVDTPVPNTTEVNVTTNLTLHLTFEEARQKIEDMTALNQEQTEEVIEKIDELEEISKEDTSRKKKWEKVKPILIFALDKGADIATAIMALVLQMKLGL